MYRLACLLPCLFAPAGGSGDGDLVVAADRLHIGDGQVLEHAVVTVRAGRIRTVSTGAPPDGALYLEGAELTPGLIDACSYMGVGPATVDSSREDTPGQKVVAGARLGAPAFRRALRDGVTAAFLTPDSLNVIGGLGALVKTHGGRAADLFAPAGSGVQVLSDAAALKVTLSGEVSRGNSPPRFGPPDSMYVRRPTTRMGAVWILRRDFFRARRYQAAKAAGTAAPDSDLEVLVDVMEGRLPIRVQARRSHDIQTALRLAGEFGWKHMIIEEATEAWRIAPLLAEAQVPVILGPGYDDLSRAVARAGPSLEEWREIADPEPVCCEDLGPEALGDHHDPDTDGRLHLQGLALDALVVALPRYSATGLTVGRRQEGDHANPAGAAVLTRAGVHPAQGAAEGYDVPGSEAGLIQQARIAVRYGLDPSDALQMVTYRAAAFCNALKRLGTVEAGKDGDLVLWSGPPLDPGSKPLIVIVDGRVAHDARPSGTPD